jgi:hypothetical protein
MSTPADDRDAAAASSPGSSSPGEPGYDGRATVGDEGAAGGSESFDDPFGRPEPAGPRGPEPGPEAPT